MTRPSGDKLIRAATAAVVVTVAAFAAVVSFSHIYDLGRAHGQSGTAARLLPLSVDGLILAASLVLLHEARNRRDAPPLGRFALWLGIGATLAANAAYGAQYGTEGVIVSTWPAVSFIVAVEMLMGLVRRARDGQPRQFSPVPFTDAQSAAAEAYRRSVAGGNPHTVNALATKFRITRPEAARVVERETAGANGHGKREEVPS